MPRYVVIAGLFCLILSAGAAQAACADDADALAKTYHLSVGLPSATASTGGGATSDKLATSGGVIAPPATGDMASVTPPVPNPEPMKTAPAVPPQGADGTSAKSPSSSTTRDAAADAQAASLLQAAREAGAKGNESACRQRLADAKALLEGKPSISQ